jgi:hypothetical protein
MNFVVEIQDAQVGKLEIACLEQVQYDRRQKQSEPQEKGRYLWFKEAVCNEVMCTRQGNAVDRFGTDATGNPSSRMASGSGFCGMFGWE